MNLKKYILIILAAIGLLVLISYIISIVFFSYGTLKVDSDFFTVEYELDGERIKEETPFEIKIKKGKHTLKATTLPRIEPFKETFSIKRNETKEIIVSFELPADEEEDASLDPALLP